MIVDLATPALLKRYLAAVEPAFDGTGIPTAFMPAAFNGDLCDAAEALGIPVMR